MSKKNAFSAQDVENIKRCRDAVHAFAVVADSRRRLNPTPELIANAERSAYDSISRLLVHHAHPIVGPCIADALTALRDPSDAAWSGVESGLESCVQIVRAIATSEPIAVESQDVEGPWLGASTIQEIYSVTQDRLNYRRSKKLWSEGRDFKKVRSQYQYNFKSLASAFDEIHAKGPPTPADFPQQVSRMKRKQP